MANIARKDKQEMLVVRQAQAEKLRRKRGSEYLKMSEDRLRLMKRGKRAGMTVPLEETYIRGGRRVQKREQVSPESKWKQERRDSLKIDACLRSSRDRGIDTARRLLPKPMQKAWYAGRTEEEKAVSRKRKAETVALKPEEESRESSRKMANSKARKSDADKLAQHIRTKATWASKTEENMKEKVKKTAETLKKMSPEDRKASSALTEVKKKATAAGKQRRKTLGLPELT
ncbi:hypothetical protein BHYA_0160g00040 [Botrytis hyacinthi]|uniref:Uncharacterized protein n=1 Tax=Botrytis hyacinthi TaxID=278943 RepID=A0A4Z1GLK2_9HELO|nr:hypothetical protein BHYA_0160g00040 [Botrytis hyacinthi]